MLPIITKPWENMWFRLGAYDKARRLPSPPYLPNYQADILLYTGLNKKAPANVLDNVSANTISPDIAAHPTDNRPSLHKHEVD